MGFAFRRYWIPALQSDELPEGHPDPVHIELLGEHFVAFRDGDGKIGVLDENCCHRGASLLLGRIEGCGIRCIYHGWKFSIDGTVLDTPNVQDPKFKTRVRARAYPVREAGGLIWVYLGQAGTTPAFPDWPWMHLAQKHRINASATINCNYVQVLEGLVDSSHLNLLHDSGMKSATASKLSFAERVAGMQGDASPRIEAEETEFGFHYAALRKINREVGPTTVARVAAFIVPCFVANPNGDLSFAVVPVNDYRTRFYHIWWNPDRAIGEEPLRSEQLRFVGLDEETMDGYGMTQAACDRNDRPRRENRYLQNRQLMREHKHFTGLPNFTQEDTAVAVSAGAMRDRSKENLSTADVAIGRLYRVLLKCAKKVQEGGDPIGIDPPIDVSHVVGIDANLADGQRWQSLVPGHTPIRASDSQA